MKEILDKTFDYLRLKIPGFVLTTRGPKLFTCPVCKDKLPTAKMVDGQIYYCTHCKQSIGNIFDFVRTLEDDKETWNDNEILKYLGKLFKVSVITEEDEEDAFNLYTEYGFDLTPVQRDGKNLFETDWPNLTHTDKEEWKIWRDKHLNIAVKTGKKSQVTVVDIDNKNLPPKLVAMLSEYKGFLQETTGGFHYAFQYEPELPSFPFDYEEIEGEEVHIDVKNDGGAIVLFPSVVEGLPRKILDRSPLPKMSEELFKFLKANVKTPGTKLKNTISAFEEIPKLEFDAKDFALGTVGEGNRHNFLLSFGGILRKKYNIEVTAGVLDLINSYFVRPSYPKKDLDILIRGLSKYTYCDNNEIAEKTLNYLKAVGDATARDVKEVINESKEIVDKTLAYLVKENLILKHKRMYQAIRRADWKEKFSYLNNNLSFKVPYFEDLGHFNWGDLILLGAKTKVGKTSIAMNIVKQLIAQGIKPYYIGLEPGSRFQKTWVDLGGQEGQFFWDFVADPTKIELEKNAVTIIDWLMIEDKAATDSVFKYFTEQLFKTQGFLFIFMQTKETNGEWFAPNMTKQFPALSARYVYTDENDGTYGKWVIDAVREPKLKRKKFELPCVYNWDTKEHKLLDDVEDKND